MRILYVLGRFPNISNTFIINEIAEICRRGHTVDIASFTRPRDFDLNAHEAVSRYGLIERTRYLDGKEVLLSVARSPRSVGAMRRHRTLWKDNDRWRGARAASLAAMLRRGGHDIVHSHFAADEARVGLSASLAAGVPFTFTTHAFDLYDRDKKMSDGDLRTMVDNSSAAVTISRYNREHLVSLCGEDAGSKISVVRCGIDPSEHAYEFSDDGATVVTVARLVEKKGIDLLIKAVGDLRRAGRAGKMKFKIVGHGPLEEKLKKMAVRLGVEDAVTFTGPIGDAELDGILSAARMFVLPCRVSSSGDRDGIPVSLMEAMARGIPVVSTGVSGIPELIEDGITGVLVEPEDHMGLARAIHGLNTDPLKRKEVSRNARKRIEEEYQIGANVGTLLKLWRGL